MIPTDSLTSDPSTLPPAPRRRWSGPGVWVATVAVLSVFIVLLAVPPYLSMDPDSSSIDLRPDSPWHFPFLVAHAATGGVALLTGPFQFVRRIRQRRALHRAIGRVYLLAGVLPASLTGAVVALLSMSGPAVTASFLLLDAAWLVTAVLAYRAARLRQFDRHREWMLRNFALTFAGVTLRLWVSVLVVVQLPWLDSSYGGDADRLFDTAYAVVAWLCWLPNLLLMEIYLARESARRARDQLGALRERLRATESPMPGG